MYIILEIHGNMCIINNQYKLTFNAIGFDGSINSYQTMCNKYKNILLVIYVYWSNYNT